MEITYKNGEPTIRSVKHVERVNFPMILYRIAKNLLQKAHSTDLVQLTHFQKHLLDDLKSCYQTNQKTKILILQREYTIPYLVPE